MPIYEYSCEDCGERFEHFARSLRDRGPRRCPACGSSEIQRQWSTFAARGSADGGGDDLCPR